MYLRLFGLKEYPFQLTPDSDFLFMSKAHARAKAYLDYAIWNRDGFVVITGEVGTGKTTLVQKFLSELDGEVTVAKIFQTQLGPVEFLQATLAEFGIRAFDATKAELIDRLNEFLLESFRRSKQVVLIVDEAQNLGYDVLEEIRMLSGLETRKQKIMHVVLVGQPELREKLESPEMSQLLQRVRLRFHLGGLSETETRAYILHRLRVAGATRDNLFVDTAFPIIFQYTGGIPRLINTLCDTAMICAFADDLRQVTAAVIKAAIEELQWVPFARRTRRAAQVRQAAGLETGMAQLLNENRRVVSALGEQIGQIAALSEAIVSAGSRFAGIEAQLRRIADQLGALAPVLSARPVSPADRTSAGQNAIARLPSAGRDERNASDEHFPGKGVA